MDQLSIEFLLINYLLKKKGENKRLIICSGKIYFELADHIAKNKIKNLSIIRLEQIYHFLMKTLR